MFINSKAVRAELLGSIETMFNAEIKMRKGEVFGKLNQELQQDLNILKLAEGDLTIDPVSKTVSIDKQVNNVRPSIIFIRDNICDFRTTVMMNELSLNLNKAVYETCRRPRAIITILNGILGIEQNRDYSIVISLRGGAGLKDADKHLANTIQRATDESSRFHNTHDIIFANLNENRFGELQFDITPINDSCTNNDLIDKVTIYLTRHGVVRDLIKAS